MLQKIYFFGQFSYCRVLYFFSGGDEGSFSSMLICSTTWLQSIKSGEKSCVNPSDLLRSDQFEFVKDVWCFADISLRPTLFHDPEQSSDVLTAHLRPCRLLHRISSMLTRLLFLLSSLLLVLLLVLFIVDVDVIVLLWSTMSLFLVVFGRISCINASPVRQRWSGCRGNKYGRKGCVRWVHCHRWEGCCWQRKWNVEMVHVSWLVNNFRYKFYIVLRVN